MSEAPLDALKLELARINPSDACFAAAAVDALLATAGAVGASDLHLQPGPDGLEVKYRMDGVLQRCGMVAREAAPNVVNRLKVLARLLTYRTDFPQEGRIGAEHPDGQSREMRVCTFPTLHGERAVVRFFGAHERFERLDDLGLPGDVAGPLREMLAETSGAILVSGPAGSGKTTTAYACLRELARQTAGGRSLVSIEDPIEAALPGVAQSQVEANSGLDLAAGLRYWMRQDPEVVLVGEIRDRATAEAALQASLTGHLLLSTFHAGSAAETVSRLMDMGIEPYVLRSGLLAIINQRLVRRLCSCAQETDRIEARLGLPVARCCVPVGCAACGGTGYRGRFVLVEMLRVVRSRLGQAILSRRSAQRLERLAVHSGMVSRMQRACEAVEAGWTSAAEVRRVLGFSAKEGRDGEC